MQEGKEGSEMGVERRQKWIHEGKNGKGKQQGRTGKVCV